MGLRVLEVGEVTAAERAARGGGVRAGGDCEGARGWEGEGAAVASANGGAGGGVEYVSSEGHAGESGGGRSEQ